MPNKQTLTKRQESLKFRFTQPVAIFFFSPPIPLTPDDWMIALTHSEVNNSIFRITKKVIKSNCSSPQKALEINIQLRQIKVKQPRSPSEFQITQGNN